MKNLKYLLVISLLIASFPVEVQAAAQASPREIACQFYTLVVREEPSGLPDTRVMQLFEPYLSQSLCSLFSRAKNKQAEAMRTHPREKPPYVGGCLFSCLYEGPKRFLLGKSIISGRFAHIEVKQSVKPEGSFEWADTLVLVKENGRWLVWDIRMRCSWPFRMGPTLRVMLGDT